MECYTTVQRTKSVFLQNNRSIINTQRAEDFIGK